MKFCLFTVAAADNVLLSDVKVCDDAKNYQLYAIMTLCFTQLHLLFFTQYSTNSRETPAWSFSTTGVMWVTRLCHSLSLCVFLLLPF